MTAGERSAAVRARVLARSPEVRRESARRAAERQWGEWAYAKNKDKADHVYSFVHEYISVKRYAPTLKEISRAVHHDQAKIRSLLQILKRVGRIQLHPCPRGIELTPIANSAAVGAALPGSSETLPVVQLSNRVPAFIKCMNCSNPAAEGMTRCVRCLILASEACKRSRDRARLRHAAARNAT
jgi:hypothetical protein